MQGDIAKMPGKEYLDDKRIRKISKEESRKYPYLGELVEKE